MRYCIGPGVMGQWSFLDISAEEFLQAKKAKRSLFVLLQIEEKFEMVVDNYLEYEQDLLELALVNMASHEVTWSSSHDAITRINRRLANCLTVSRLYVDQAKHDLSGIYGTNAETTTRVTQAFSAQYDRLLGYRVMYELRNFLQHRSLLVTRLTYPRTREDRSDDFVIHHQVTAQLQVKELRDDDKFKRSVLDELKQSEYWEITPLLRQSIEGLSCAHKELRKATHQDIEPWKNTLLDLITRYQTASSADFKSIVAYHLDDEEDTVEEIQLFHDGIDRLETLRNKRLPTNISRWYVSNEHA